MRKTLLMKKSNYFSFEATSQGIAGRTGRHRQNMSGCLKMP